MSKWTSEPLKNLATFQKGKKVVTSDILLDGFLNYLGAGSLVGKHDGYASTKFAVLSKNDDILMLWDGERSGLVGYGLEGVVSSTVTKITPNEKILGSFLYYYLQSYFEWIQNRRTGTGVPHVPKDLSRILQVGFPKSIVIQQKITTILSTIDETIEHTETLIEKYQHIKAGMMNDLFTRGVLPDGTLRPTRDEAPELYHETPIGWIPKVWKFTLLDSMTFRGSGHTPNKSIPNYWNGGIKWISLADSFRLDNLYISETEYEISAKGILNSSAVIHTPGSVVLSRDAGVGKSAIMTESMAVSQHFMCWRCSDQLNNHFLYYWLQFNKRYFENIAMGSTILTIGLNYFKKLYIQCPIITDEQNIIAEKLLIIDKYLTTLRDDLQKKQKQKSGLMHDLLTGEVRVKPDQE